MTPSPNGACGSGSAVPCVRPGCATPRRATSGLGTFRSSSVGLGTSGRATCRSSSEPSSTSGAGTSVRRWIPGAGTSGRLAVQDAVELAPTFDWPADRLVLLLAGGLSALTRAAEGAEDDAEAARRAVAEHQVGGADIAIGLAASGRTPFTCAVLQECGVRGALTIGIANSPDAPLLTLAAHPILVETGAEPVAGSTRLKAGTAQKIVLNLLSTALMLRLGRVHDGLMVDLRAGNAKLRARALRTLRHLTGAEADPAAAALATAGGNVKTAVLLLHGLDLPAAQTLLARHDGHLRPALQEISR